MAHFEFPEWACVGARVSLNRDHPDNNRSLVSGDVGTIVNRSAISGLLYVEWDKDCGGHDCGGNAKSGHGWNVDLRDVNPSIFCGEEIEYKPTSMDELLSFLSM